MEDEENFLLLNISIFSPLLKVHPLRISFNFWRFSLGKNGSIRPSLNRKSWIREARVIHSRGIFQTLNQNFLRFGIKDPCKLGNVNSIKGRDSFSRKFPQRKISVRGESSSCYARPVSRMDNGEPVEREQRRVEGGGELVRIFSFFFFFSRRQTRNESFHQLDGRRGMQLSSLSFRNVRIAARRRAIVFNNYRSLKRGFQRIPVLRS